MKRDDIEIGETYLFMGSDSPKRKHLAGQPFTVTSKDQVYRKVSYRHKKRSMKVTRFFNDDGVGARAEELGTLPKTGFYHCKNENCRKWSRVEDLTVESGPGQFCGHCGEMVADGETTQIAHCGAQVRLDFEACQPGPSTKMPEPLCTGCNKYVNELPEYIEAAQDAETTPEAYVRSQEGTYNPINGHFLCTDCYIAQGMPTAPGGWLAP
jgi:hypothetical protein